MTALALPPVEYLRECFHYDPHSGELRWRRRPRHHFASERAYGTWNARFANKSAGSLIRDKDQTRLRVSLAGAEYYAHRVIWTMMTGTPPHLLVDHKDCDGTNNRWENLRLATNQQNQWNKPKQRGASALPKGISFQTGLPKPYVVHICLGSFATVEEAQAAWETAARQLHGEYFHP